MKSSSNILEKVISPTNKNMLSELLYDRGYINTTQFINKYSPPSYTGYKGVKDLGIELTSFDKFFSEVQVPTENFR